MIPAPARLALLGTLALALACGDDGDDDTAAGTTAAGTTAADTAPAETTAAGTATASGDETADPAVVCEALACEEGQICVATGACPEEPSCVPGEMVACDFGSGVCTALDVCSGTMMDGVLDCEQCL
jgi:hypothetical protein